MKSKVNHYLKLLLRRKLSKNLIIPLISIKLISLSHFILTYISDISTKRKKIGVFLKEEEIRMERYGKP